MKKPVRYTNEFRAEIVKLHLGKRRSIKSLAEEYGISESTIQRWVTKYRNGGLK